MKFLSDIRTRVSALVDEQKLQHDKRSLENKLKQILEVTEGHKATGLPAGHKYYILLWQEAQSTINSFIELQKTRGEEINYDQVAIGVPGLRELEALTHVVPEDAQKNKIVGMAVPIAVAAGIAWAMGTTVLALSYDWFHLLTSWIMHHV